MQKVERSGGEWVSLLKCQLFAWSKRWVDKFHYASGWWVSCIMQTGGSACFMQTGGSACFMQTGGSACFIQTGGSACFIQTGGSACFIQTGGSACFIQTGGSACTMQQRGGSACTMPHEGGSVSLIRRVVGQVQRYKYVIQYFTLTKPTYQNSCIKLYFLNPPDRSLSNHSRIPHTWRYLGSPREQ
jgi:hypothetical protein